MATLGSDGSLVPVGDQQEARILFSLFPGSGFILGRRFQPTATEALLPDPRHRDCLGREVALVTLLDDYSGVRLRNRSVGNRLRADGEEAGQPEARQAESLQPAPRRAR